MVADVVMVMKPLIIRIYDGYLFISGYKVINNLLRCYKL